MKRRATAGVIGVVVGDDDLRDPRRVEAVAPHELENPVGAGPEAGVDERKLYFAVDQVRVAIEAVGQVEPVVAAPDQVDVLGELHSPLLATEHALRHCSGTE